MKGVSVVVQSLREVAAAGGRVVGVSFNGEEADEAGWQGLVFEGCSFSECRFERAVIAGVSFVNCRFSHCSFKEATLQDCVFFDGEGRIGTEWRFCDFSQARFLRCNLGMNRLVACHAYQLELEECSGTGIQFEAEVHKPFAGQTLLGGVMMRRCKLQYAVFAPGNYEGSRFEGCDLRDSSFVGSRLKGVSFRGSALHQVDFTGSVLDGADLTVADFDDLGVREMASFQGMKVGRAQWGAVLHSFGILAVETDDLVILR